jgi:hypothetical protein
LGGYHETRVRSGALGKLTAGKYSGLMLSHAL